MLATLHVIRQGDYADTLRLCRRLPADPEDLIHKACGWMLREVGRRDRDVLERFLGRHAAVMPSTILRYAIERLLAASRRRPAAPSECPRSCPMIAPAAGRSSRMPRRSAPTKSGRA